MKRLVAIQHVHLHWDKSGRGAEWGAVRNAAPRELPFRPPGESGKGWLQSVRLEHAARYRPAEQWHDLDGIDAERLPVSLKQIGDFLHVALRIRTRFPMRPHLDGVIAHLPLGQRMSVRVNCKADGDHDRWYFEDHLHIGWTEGESATLDLPLFRDIDERVLLY